MRAIAVIVAVVGAAAGAWLLVPADHRLRLRRALPRPSGPGRAAPDHGARRPPRWSHPVTIRAASALAGIAAWLLVGGPVGIGAGAVIAIAGPVALGRLESRSARERREAIARQAGDCADLLAACLASGAPVAGATAAVARALGPPVRGPLDRLVAALDLGADPAAAWAELGREPGLAALARAVTRSLETGAPLSGILPGIADDLRRESRARAESAARAAGVRAVAPLAACFLPAFLLVGVVPVIASLALPVLGG